MRDHILTAADLAAYQAYLEAEERAAATVTAYRRDAERFAAWLGGQEATRESLREWKEHLLSRGQAPATVNRKLAAGNCLFRFLGWEDCQVKFLRVQRRAFRDDARDLTCGEYGRLLETARRQGRERLALLLETICSTGIRVSEVCYITAEAVEAGRAEVSLKGKVRTILLPGKLVRKLRKYIQKRKIISGAVFRAGDGTSISRFQIWRAMKSLCAEAGVEPSKVFPHNLRHLFAVTFYRATRDIAKLADVLGHSSLDTTRVYLRTTGAEHVRCLDRLRLVT